MYLESKKDLGLLGQCSSLTASAAVKMSTVREESVNRRYFSRSSYKVFGSAPLTKYYSFHMMYSLERNLN